MPAASNAAHTFQWNARLRHEQVDDDRFAKDANALTFRARVGLHSQWNDQWSTLLELEGNTRLGGDFNSFANGQSSYPAIADPNALEVNQAWVAWQQQSGLNLKFGRQRLQMDDMRFIGNAGWRQHERTFDAIWASHQWNEQWSVTLGYIDKAHRIFTDSAIDPLRRERDLSTYVARASYAQDGHQLSAFMIWDKHLNEAALSRTNVGVYGKGEWPVSSEAQLGYQAAWAYQDEHADAPQISGHHYWKVAPFVSFSTWKLTAGLETLQGDGQHAFITPLASLHGPNGWADQFLGTPGDGLRDRFVDVQGSWQLFDSIKPLELRLAHHAFESVTHGDSLGSEWDAALTIKPSDDWSYQIKLADYDGGTQRADVKKIWFTIQWQGMNKF